MLWKYISLWISVCVILHNTGDILVSGYVTDIVSKRVSMML